jgi:putative membrane protein
MLIACTQNSAEEKGIFRMRNDQALLGRYPAKARAIAPRLAIAAYLALVIGFAWNPSPFAQALAAIGIGAALIHASLAYGLRHALTLFLICTVIAFAMENLGVATGFPFGRYHHEVGRDLPHIGAIPLIVGPIWFVIGYFSWVVAGILLDDADFRLQNRFNAIVLPIAAAFVATQWDLVMDAPSATISKAWVWHDGGAFFGVPASNFFGWLLTAWLFYQAFALYLRQHAAALTHAAAQSRAFRLLAVVFYLCAGLTHLTPWLAGQAGETADGGGHIWRIQDLRESAVLVMIFTMGFTALLAFARLSQTQRHRAE